MKADFRKKEPQKQTLSKGCCLKWYIEEERRFYKTSSFKFGDDESTSELIATVLLEGSPFPFVSYYPCEINCIFNNEERTEAGVWSDSFLLQGERYIDMLKVLETNGMRRRFDAMTVEEKYNYTIKTLSGMVKVDIAPFINFMMSFDFVIGNIDRHCGNFGLIADNDGSYKPAPIFDNGLSLWAKKRLPGEECEPFSSFSKRQIVYTKSKVFLEFIKQKPLKAILEKHNDYIDCNALYRFMTDRIEYLQSLLCR